MNAAPILEIDNLHITFATPRENLQAVCGVSFAINEGEIFGIVGESGCGKSVTGLSVLRLIPAPGRITSGAVRLRGMNLLEKSEREMRDMRGSSIAMIFQDPSTSLNPVFTIGAQLTAVLAHHQHLKAQAAKTTILDAFHAVGLPDGERVFRAYPHELSGGMQQRAMIAMALICRPSILIADEPTTALDVTIQAQILRLLHDLRDRFGVAIMLITHDLGVVREICDRVAVMYAGRIVESGNCTQVFQNPRHPYTQGLIAATPSSAARGTRLKAIPGIVPPNPGKVSGCGFASRCAAVMERCRESAPPTYPTADGHSCACYLYAPDHVGDNEHAPTP